MLYLPEALTVVHAPANGKLRVIWQRWFAATVHYGEETSLVVVEGAESQPI